MSEALPATMKRGRGRPRKDEAPNPEQILKAALAAFARHGWDGANLRMIAEMAEVDASLIARRFDGKMGLWRAVVDSVSEALRQSHDLGDLSALPVTQQLGAFVERFVRLSLDRPDLGRFFIDEIARPGVRREYVIERIWSVHRDALLPLLVQASAQGNLPQGTDPETFMSILIGAVAMPLVMRSVALPNSDTTAGREAFVRNIMALFQPGMSVLESASDAPPLMKVRV